MAKVLHLKDVHWSEQDLGGKRPDRSVCITRYGGIGDAIQTSSVLPEFKKLGYYICLNVEERTFNILKNDPNIDEFFIQGKNQVKNTELGEYWSKLAPLFTKHVNFCECVEGSCLAVPARVHYYWPQKARHKYMNHNYIELMHDIADVPYSQSNVKFYASSKEKKWAAKERKKIKGKVLLWVLSGSSVHKFTPHSDRVLQGLQRNYPDLHTVFIGDDACRILETGWEDNPKVWCRSGEWNIRKSLAFAELCDIIIGPETGVLNAMSMEPMKKIIMLSHSSIDNLSRDWVNTTSMIPTDVPCYPCHKMHHGTKYCNTHSETGAAMCAYNIHPKEIYEAIEESL